MDDYAGGATMYSPTCWEVVENKMKELQSNDANTPDRATGTSRSCTGDKTSAISSQGGKPPPATNIDNVPLQTSTPWEYNKFLAGIPRPPIDLNSYDRRSYIYDKFWSIYGHGPNPPFATEYDERYFQLMKRDAEFHLRWKEFKKFSRERECQKQRQNEADYLNSLKEKERQKDDNSLDPGVRTSNSYISNKTLSISHIGVSPPANTIDPIPPEKTR